jgi:short-subunit dehydrogenase
VLLQHKWIVITGGSSGIGAAIARQAGARGNRITIVADDAEHLERSAATLRSSGVEVDAIRCDIGNAGDVDHLAAELLASTHAPDVLINNAGFGTYRAFEAASLDEIDRLLDVNLSGHVRLTKHLCTPMVARKSGAICFMASIAGRIPITPNATYCAAKHGMMGLAEALRFELAQFGVEVSAVCPGRVDTRFFDHETFLRRTTGPENRSSIPVDRVADATIRAIEANRRITFVPRALGLGTWIFDALPVVSRPLFAYLMKARMERLYADASR